MIGKLFYLMIICVLLFTVDGLGQKTWVKTFVGGSLEHYGNSIIPTKDGGYILTGETSFSDGNLIDIEKGLSDILVMKLDSNGDIIWKNIFGGSDYDCGNSLINTIDSGYILTGWTKSKNGDFSGTHKFREDIFVMKLNSKGKIVWKKVYGGSGIERGNSIKQSKDGGYVLTGTTSSNDGDFSKLWKGGIDIIVLKLNSKGKILWKRTYGGFLNDKSYSIIETDNGEYILTGSSDSNDGDFSEMNILMSDIIVLKLNTKGNIVWKKIYGGRGTEEGISIIQTKDGGYVLTGTTSSNDGDFIGIKKGLNYNTFKGFDEDIFVFKLNYTGDILWCKIFGGSNDDKVFSIIETTDDGFVLTGGSNSIDGDFSELNKGKHDIIVLKLKSNGDLKWKETFGGSDNEVGSSIVTTNDDGYLLTGITKSYNGDFKGINKGSEDIFVMKIDKNGNLNKK
jgi:hypothetical protein